MLFIYYYSRYIFEPLFVLTDELKSELIIIGIEQNSIELNALLCHCREYNGITSVS